MIPSSQNRKVVHAAGIFLAVTAFVTCSFAQAAAGTKSPPNIQGESTGVTASQPAATPTVTNPSPTAPAKAGACAAAPVETPAPAGKYLDVQFDKLASFDFDPPSTTNQVATVDDADKLIPKGIMALDKKKVTVTGYMIPTTMNGDKVTEFLIIRNQFGCCFGSPPKLNELVTVKIPGKGVAEETGQPVTIKGTLHVGTIRDAGDVTGLYRMDGEALVGE
jgi:hypothetical protein